MQINKTIHICNVSQCKARITEPNASEIFFKEPHIDFGKYAVFSICISHSNIKKDNKKDRTTDMFEYSLRANTKMSQHMDFEPCLNIN
ncbi:hypothetical protein V1477_010069 [Vespula maculifrons]|uniref:Uncharacterized protein n=1 Tax=Vespula maculifrons TaxID=7453 RepID=A0ABD2CBL2_VESMC